MVAFGSENMVSKKGTRMYVLVGTRIPKSVSTGSLLVPKKNEKRVPTET
jgi:hypothetical protein